jgi:hypothetical protein
LLADISTPARVCESLGLAHAAAVGSSPIVRIAEA